MSEDLGTERPQEQTEQPAGGEETAPPEIEHPDPLGGDDESGYGGAGQSETGQENNEQSGPNRPPSEQDEDQGI